MAKAKARDKILSLEKLEELLTETDDSSELPPTDILAYNELRSCFDLFRLHREGILEIQPGFQRDIIWTLQDQTRFIDSLAKRLPIPSMCFAYDDKQEQRLVIDGLQRIATIVAFLDDKKDWKLAQIDDVDPRLAGVSTKEMRNPKNKELYQLYKKIENVSIPVTVLSCNFTKFEHLEYLFTIFHRLNSKGVKLTNQEIRHCIFSGKFNSLLKKLDANVSWRKLNNMKKNNNYRMRKQELILRFFAFYEKISKYDGQMSRFLNSFMKEKRFLADTEKQKYEKLFADTLAVVTTKILPGKAIPRMPFTIIEGMMVGVAKNLPYLQKLQPKDAKALLAKMRAHPDFSDEKLAEGLTKTGRVKDRITAAIAIFAGK